MWPELAAFVIGNKPLDSADFKCELDLCVAFFFSKTCEALSQGLFSQVKRR